MRGMIIKLYTELHLAGNNDGVFFAQLVTLDSDSDSEVDTDDAQTVIFKSSPYSSPGPGKDRSIEFKYHLTKLFPSNWSQYIEIFLTPGHPLSRSTSATNTSPSSPSETPPPRPPPPTDYQPSFNYFQSLPRNWRERQKFLFPYS